MTQLAPQGTTSRRAYAYGAAALAIAILTIHFTISLPDAIERGREGSATGPHVSRSRDGSEGGSITTASPSISRASDAQKIGRPCAKLVVPSSGSNTQR